MYYCKLSLIVFVSLLEINSLSQNGWVIQESGVNSSLKKIQMINFNTGYSCGSSGYILKTTNSGANWVAQVTGTNYNFESLTFINENTGWAISQLSNYTIYKTSNGGQNWNLVFTTTDRLTRLHFFDANTGLALGGWSSGYIYRTTNSGINWFSISNSVNGEIVNVSFINTQTGWIVTDNGRLYKTVNGGENWTQQYLLTGGQLNTVYFINSETGWLGGSLNSEGIIQKSTNGGSNWSTQFNNNSVNRIYSLNFKDSLRGGAVGGPTFTNNYVTITTNGGLNWLQYSMPSTTYLYFIQFVDNNTGWMVGYAAGTGRIWKTTNGGLTSFSNIGSESPNTYSLSQNYPNPFNPITKFKFDLPRRGHVKLNIYDLSGKEIQNVIDGDLNPGTYEFDFDGRDLASGVYFYKLETQEFRDTKKMIVLK